MQIEPCPVCGGKMRHEGMWKCEKVMCPYQVRPDPRSIAAHNALSLTAQRAEQLEHFAELAKPIVEWSRDYTRDGPVANWHYTDALTCLAALSEKPEKPEKPKEASDDDTEL